MNNDRKVVDQAAPATLAEEAKVSPTTVFQNPKDVVKTGSLTTQEKSEVLTQWEADAQALQRATDEGMSGGQRPRLDEVKKAQHQLATGRSWRQLMGSNVVPDPGAAAIGINDARQGETGHNVRYILGLGLAGTIGVFVLLAIYLNAP